MALFDFSPFGNDLMVVRFKCVECGEQVQSDNIEIPHPDYSADTAYESTVEGEGHAMCDECMHKYEIGIYVDYAGGTGQIEDLPDDYEVEVEEISIEELEEAYYDEQFEAISGNTRFLTTFKTEVVNLKQLNELVVGNQSTDQTLKRQIYVGVIASMEAYLSDAFINTTLNSMDLTKRFVSSFKDFSEVTIKLNQLFDYESDIYGICRRSMLDVMYHNLPKVKGMYKDTLGVDLGEIGTVYKAVLNRHDLVHRNGKNKEGEELQLTKGIIDELLTNVDEFISRIDAQIKSNHEIVN
jgi:hypothetical protein